MVSPASEIARAVATLRAGGLVAFPTETVYGLGADAENPDALARLFAVKGRPTDHPVIVHVGASSALDEWAIDVPDTARELAAQFWPGPLTLVTRAGPRVSRLATGGLDTVGLRVPDHPLALDLLRAFGGGVAAPSANRFGQVSPTTADAVRRELGDDVDRILDGGPCVVGVESTIVECTGDEVAVLRPGRITSEMIEAVLGRAPNIGGTTRAPGSLPAHYAPDARVELVAAAEVESAVVRLRDGGHRVGVLGLAADVVGLDSAVTLATVVTVDEYARVLYAALRAADEMGIDVVVAVPPAAVGIGIAVRDRLRRAATAGSVQR
ncbi:MAG: threonylcarbamoyl-AMP synthase [Acidimicrobiia bacterium]|nr:threonylcarbamoyl-AMP synthase [Acidimicrobiia bacterium]